MLVCPLGGRPTAGGSLDQSLLKEIRLVHILDRVGLLANGYGERREADRTAAELLADRAQDLAIEPVESLVVDLEQIERLAAPPAR